MSVLGSTQESGHTIPGNKRAKERDGLNGWGKKRIEIGPESLTQEFR